MLGYNERTPEEQKKERVRSDRERKLKEKCKNVSLLELMAHLKVDDLGPSIFLKLGRCKHSSPSPGMSYSSPNDLTILELDELERCLNTIEKERSMKDAVLKEFGGMP